MYHQCSLIQHELCIMHDPRTYTCIVASVEMLMRYPYMSLLSSCPQEKISENSGYFGIRDCDLNDRKVVTYSEQR